MSRSNVVKLIKLQSKGRVHVPWVNVSTTDIVRGQRPTVSPQILMQSLESNESSTNGYETSDSHGRVRVQRCIGWLIVARPSWCGKGCNVHREVNLSIRGINSSQRVGIRINWYGSGSLQLWANWTRTRFGFKSCGLYHLYTDHDYLAQSTHFIVTWSRLSFGRPSISETNATTLLDWRLILSPPSSTTSSPCAVRTNWRQPLSPLAAICLCVDTPVNQGFLLCWHMNLPPYCVDRRRSPPIAITVALIAYMQFVLIPRRTIDLSLMARFPCSWLGGDYAETSQKRFINCCSYCPLLPGASSLCRWNGLATIICCEITKVSQYHLLSLAPCLPSV
jgi:hypothetical protein